MIRIVASVTTWLALTAVLVISGGHAVYYLLEWEWVRAQIAGIAFVAALVVSATLVLLARLRALEQRLDALARAAVAAPAPVAATDADAGPEPRPDFAWLAPTSGWSALALPILALVALREPAPAVFIPIFLATGIAVSVVASGVERLAALRHPAAAAPLGATGAVGARRPVGYRTALAVPAGGMVVVGAVIGGLWLGAHYWSEPVGAGTTTLTVEVERNGRASTDPEVAEVVGRYCVLNAGVDVRFRDVVATPEGVLLRVTPLLDADAQERFGGCLEDAVLDRHRLAVTDVQLTPR